MRRCDHNLPLSAVGLLLATIPRPSWSSPVKMARPLPRAQVFWLVDGQFKALVAGEHDGASRVVRLHAAHDAHTEPASDGTFHDRVLTPYEPITETATGWRRILIRPALN